MRIECHANTTILKNQACGKRCNINTQSIVHHVKSTYLGKDLFKPFRGYNILEKHVRIHRRTKIKPSLPTHSNVVSKQILFDMLEIT